jgi:hypothetical protein
MAQIKFSGLAIKDRESCDGKASAVMHDGQNQCSQWDVPLEQHGCALK